MDRTKTAETISESDVQKQYEEGESPDQRHSVMQLAAKAASGDEEALQRVLTMLDEKQHETQAVSIEDSPSDPFGLDALEAARVSLVRSAFGDNKLFQALGRRSLDGIEQRAAGTNPSPLERLLAEQIAVCWLQLYHYEERYAQRLNKQPEDLLGFQREEFYHKRVARAQRRYESAIKSLAQVRRLQLPVLQVNMAKNQVNLGSGHVTAGQAQINGYEAEHEEQNI